MSRSSKQKVFFNFDSVQLYKSIIFAIDKKINFIYGEYVKPTLLFWGNKQFEPGLNFKSAS